MCPRASCLTRSHDTWENCTALLHWHCSLEVAACNDQKLFLDDQDLLLIIINFFFISSRGYFSWFLAMSGGPAYIGKPPPQWTRKRREWEQQRAREREVAEQERELSPAVPDPPVTPSRSAIFGSPNKSARVYKTYAHKRARSQASSVAGEPDDAQDDGE